MIFFDSASLVQLIQLEIRFEFFARFDLRFQLKSSLQGSKLYCVLNTSRGKFPAQENTCVRQILAQHGGVRAGVRRRGAAACGRPRVPVAARPAASGRRADAVRLGADEDGEAEREAAEDGGEDDAGGGRDEQGRGAAEEVNRDVAERNAPKL